MNVIDEVDNNRFVLETDEGTAQLVYSLDGDRMTLTHTEVPEVMGGKGIGGQLVAAAVQRARTSGETIVPQCPYARAWLEKHPDELAGVSVDFGS